LKDGDEKIGVEVDEKKREICMLFVHHASWKEEFVVDGSRHGGLCKVHVL
jgi:hypothetical protein